MRQYDLTAVALRIGGAASIVLQANYIPDRCTLEELKDFVKSEKSIIYYVSLVAVLILASISYYVLLVTLKNLNRLAQIT